MTTKVQLVNSVEAWDANRRYKINAIVTHLGSDWQNTTGINSEPSVGSDWTRLSGNSQTLQEVSNNGGFDNGSTVKKGTTDAGNGGAKGVAFKCSLDYEFKWEAGRLYVMEQDGFTIREVSHNFTNIPTVTDDVTKGFVEGSKWILDNGNVFVCTDNTLNAAVWELYSSPPKYKVYTALLTQSGGDDPQSRSGGDVTIGVTYEILDNGAGGYDFTNIGAPNNISGTKFVATGTTPTEWGDGSLIYNTGAPVVKVLENTIGNVWFVYLYLGNYACYCSTPLFTVNKTVLNSETFYSNNNDQMCALISNTADFDGQSVVFSSTITTGSVDFRDNSLQNTFFEIRVYN